MSDYRTNINITDIINYILQTILCRAELLGAIAVETVD